MNRSHLPALDLLATKTKVSGFDLLALGYRNAKSASDQIEIVALRSLLREIERELEIEPLRLLQLQLRDTKNKDGHIEVKAGEIVGIPLEKNRLGLRELLFFALPSEESMEQRKAGASLGRRVKGKRKKVLLATKVTPSFVESLLLANYQWSEKSKKNQDAPSFTLADGSKMDPDRIRKVVSAVYLARDLIHTPSNVKTPAWVAARITELARKIPRVTVKTKSGKEISNFGGLIAVGGSSRVHPPRFVTVTYTPPRARADVVLVGKGITFDTGGVSLKRPYDVMMAMKTDMSGAAVVAATTFAAAQLRLPVKVTALLMLAENTLSATAQRPSDVITHYGGTTVEVINTDAEGRLVLADGLAYADRHLDPDYLIDVATLTGAASLGLGKQYGAMYTRDKRLASRLHEVSEVAGDRLWHMPLVDDYSVALRSEIADFNHLADKPKFGAGSITAALFLEKFVGNRRWVHLDIAGPARSEVDAGEYVKGGTGFGVRTLTSWLETL
jgi:leucyl aminopeptidase